MGLGQRLCAGVALLLACGGSTAKPSPPVPDEGASGESEAQLEAQQIESIALALNEFSPAVHTCWARGAADGYRLQGQIVIALEIATGGSAEAKVVDDNVGDAVLSECLLTLWSSYRWPKIFSEGDRIQLPPFDFVAPTAQYSVALSHVPVHKVADGKLKVQILIDENNSGNAQAALSVLSASDGIEVPLHTHDSAELLFVLRGGGEMTGIGNPQTLEPGSAVYIPAGVVHGFVHKGEALTELVQLYTPAGAEGRFKNPANTAGTTPFTGNVPKRGARPIVRTAAKAEAFELADGKGEVRIIVDEPISKDGAAYVGAITAESGAKIPLHRHAKSSEYLLVLEGAADMSVAGKPILVQAGDAIQLPKTVEHGATIVGDETFKALQFYAPAGPEQRFKGTAAAPGR